MFLTLHVPLPHFHGSISLKIASAYATIAAIHITLTFYFFIRRDAANARV